MVNIDNFKRQHKDIMEEINHMNSLVMRKDYDNHLEDLVRHINSLAGKIKIHLSMEDRFLYPALFNGEDSKLKDMSNVYIDEMGYIAGAYVDYKNKFNTKSKILDNIGIFKIQTDDILNRIKKRIIKEESELYKLITEKGI